MGVVTVSLFWGKLPREGWWPELNTVDPNGKVINSKTAMGWNVKLAGLAKVDRASFLKAMMGDQEHYLTEQASDTLIWFIKRTQYDPVLSYPYDETLAITDNKEDPPIESVTKYLSKLYTLGYKLFATPTVVNADTRAVWTLEYSASDRGLRAFLAN